MIRLEQAKVYLRDQAPKLFTVIHTVLLSEMNGLETPNAYGHQPLPNSGPLQPNHLPIVNK